ncbi:unnamed protein product, partial [Adineta steineri]
NKDLWAQGIPGQYTPIVGDILNVRRAVLADDPLSFMVEMRKKYGSYYHTSFGPVPRLCTSDPSLIQGVLKTNARFYHNIHSQHRRLIAPVFQYQNINSMISLMVELTSNLLTKWKLTLHDVENKEKELTIDMQNEMTHLTLDIVTGCVFGNGLMKNENVRDIIYRNVTTTLEDVQNRTLNMIGLIPIINRLPFPSKQRIDKSKQDVRIVIQRIIDD